MLGSFYRVTFGFCRDSVTSDEIAWVAQAVGSGAIGKGFVSEGMEEDMERFLVETWAILPRVSDS